MPDRTHVHCPRERQRGTLRCGGCSGQSSLLAGCSKAQQTPHGKHKQSAQQQRLWRRPWHFASTRKDAGTD
eukprot:s569_g22.t1